MNTAEELETRYFKVTIQAGAFWDGIWYPPASEAADPMDSVVPVQMRKGQKAPLWGVETDAYGNELNADAQTEQIQSPAEQLGNALADKIAGKATEPQNKQPAIPSKDAEQRKQVILDTLDLLDKSDDTHWTAEGLPNMKVVCETAGIEITRAELTEIAPDFKRA